MIRRSLAAAVVAAAAGASIPFKRPVPNFGPSRTIRDLPTSNERDWTKAHCDMAARRKGDPATWGGSEKDSRNVKNLTDDSELPPGEWNTLVIECSGDRIDVWLNGDRVNDGFGCTATSGSIALQAEGAEVEFRKLLMTPLGEV